MKFIPRHSQIMGRMTIKKSDSTIILIDATKVTKYLFVDAVGPVAAAKGIEPGNVLVVTQVKNIVLDAGRVFIAVSQEEDVAFFVTDIVPSELLMQKLNGKEFVPFDSEEAAPSFGAPPIERKLNGETQYAAEA